MSSVFIVFLISAVFLPFLVEEVEAFLSTLAKETLQTLPPNREMEFGVHGELKEGGATYIDSHCHLHFNDNEPPPGHGVQVCPMSVDEEDWERVVHYRKLNPSSVYSFGFGVHPWYTDGISDHWLDKLEERLLEYPDAIVGEIGLDRAKSIDRRAGEWAGQVRCFEAQMRLAARLGRPASVHCVRAWGALADSLRALAREGGEEGAGLPPAVAIHSYTGSAEFAQSLLSIPELKDRIYFGFSHLVNARNPKNIPKLVGVLAALPEDRLLLESDAEGGEEEGEEEGGVAAGLDRMCELLCSAKASSLPTLADAKAKVLLNTMHFFSRGGCSSMQFKSDEKDNTVIKKQETETEREGDFVS